MSASQVPKEGDIVEMVRSTTEKDYGHSPRLREGSRFVVQEVIPALQPGDDVYGNDDYEQGPLVSGWLNGDVEIPVNLVKVVVPAEQVTRPTPKDILKSLRMEDDRYFNHESGWESEDERYFAFTDTETGQEWHTVVKLVQLGEAD